MLTLNHSFLLSIVLGTSRSAAKQAGLALQGSPLDLLNM